MRAALLLLAVLALPTAGAATLSVASEARAGEPVTVVAQGPELANATRVVANVCVGNGVDPRFCYPPQEMSARADGSWAATRRLDGAQPAEQLGLKVSIRRADGNVTVPASGYEWVPIAEEPGGAVPLPLLLAAAALLAAALRRRAR